MTEQPTTLQSTPGIPSDVPPGMPKEDNPDTKQCQLCSQPIETRKDDMPTPDICSNCERAEEANKGRIFNLHRLKLLGGLKIGSLLSVDPHLYTKILRLFCKTVKRDPITKQAVFLTGLSAYTEDPLNLFLRGESSLGKTYVVMQIMKLFPKRDVWKIGAASPKFLIRQHGVIVDENNEHIDFSKKPGMDAPFEEQREWAETLKNAKRLIDMTGKILLFLEAPDPEVFNIIRSILSHDDYEISYPFVDTWQGIRTVNVVVRGWPSTIFCTSSEKHVQDLATRSLTLTPVFQEEKYQAANILTGDKSALPWKYTPSDDEIAVQEFIESLKLEWHKIDVVLPFGKEFGIKFPHKNPRSMRDFQHILSMIKVLAYLHYAQRPALKYGEKKIVLATSQDYNTIMNLWAKIAETTQTGIPAQVLEFYNDVVLECTTETPSITLLTDIWNANFPERKKSSDAIRNWTELLSQIGYLTKLPDPNDKRQKLVKPLKLEKTRYYTILELSSFFSLDSAKAWLKQIETIFHDTPLKCVSNLIYEKPLAINDLYRHQYGNSTCVGNICLPPNQPLNPIITPEIDGHPKIVQSPLFPKQVNVPCFNPCYFCQKPILETDVMITNNFTGNTPAHKVCYDSKQAELRKEPIGGTNDR